MSTTETSRVEPAPPKPGATKIVDPAKPPAPEPKAEDVEARFPTRAGPKWKGPMTRGGPKWKGLEERPRVTREPINATEPPASDKP